ncbi:MAG: hypothetical protein ABSF61_04025 [Anaerolineales bacterium]|jgi:hypothetical protein
MGAISLAGVAKESIQSREFVMVRFALDSLQSLHLDKQLTPRSRNAAVSLRDAIASSYDGQKLFEAELSG